MRTVAKPGDKVTMGILEEEAHSSWYDMTCKGSGDLGINLERETREMGDDSV